MATGIGNAVLITVSLGISVAMFVYMRRKLRSAKDASDAAPCLEEEEDKRNGGEGKCQKSSGLVCFEGGEELRLESLLKASAEVLGKGVSGSTYKAVLEDGIVVAVKRLSALQFPAGRRKAFDRHMRLVGRLRHRHVVSLREYCNSNGERLLVYDFLPNGSLHSLLQANGGLRRAEMRKKNPNALPICSRVLDGLFNLFLLQVVAREAWTGRRGRASCSAWRRA